MHNSKVFANNTERSSVLGEIQKKYSVFKLNLIFPLPLQIHCAGLYSQINHDCVTVQLSTSCPEQITHPFSPLSLYSKQRFHC